MHYLFECEPAGLQLFIKFSGGHHLKNADRKKPNRDMVVIKSGRPNDKVCPISAVTPQFLFIS